MSQPWTCAPCQEGRCDDCRDPAMCGCCGVPSGKTATLYARIDRELVEWIRRQSLASGLSMARVTGLMLAWCQQQGAQIGSVNVTVAVSAVTVAGTPKAAR